MAAKADHVLSRFFAVALAVVAVGESSDCARAESSQLPTGGQHRNVCMRVCGMRDNSFACCLAPRRTPAIGWRNITRCQAQQSDDRLNPPKSCR